MAADSARTRRGGGTRKVAVASAPPKADPVEPAEVLPAVNDGSVIITLETGCGSADIRVPRMGLWRSTARNALMTRGDDLAWAAATLSPEDAEAWIELDPTTDESTAFIAAFFRAVGFQMNGLGMRTEEPRRGRR